MMKIPPFALERYYAKYEFTSKYMLSSSDCEALPMAKLLEMADDETRSLWNDLKLGYTESPGHPLLREAISEIYRGLGADEVLVMVPEEGIFLLMHALLEPGDHVVCSLPAYQSLHEVARSIGCSISTWEPIEEQGWRFDVAALERKLRPDTKLVIVNFPHNPTGYLPPRQDFQAMIDLVQARGIYLLSDEMYRFLEVEEGSTLPAACELYDKAFSLFGLSKCFGLPGLRIGWITTHNRPVMERLTQLKDYTTICNSAPGEILAIMALRNRDQIVGEQLARVRRNLSLLDEFFAKYSKYFAWNRPKGGSICFPRLLNVNNTGLFCERLVQETGIMLVPSAMFQFGNQHVRIGFGRQNLPEVLEVFGEYLDKQGANLWV